MKKALYLCIVLVFGVVSLFAQTPDANGVLYVKKGASGMGSSWSDAIGELSAALNLTAFNRGQIKEIWVAKGTYAPGYSPEWNSTDVHEYSFRLLPDLNIYGGFAGTETAVSERDLLNTANASVLTGEMNGNFAYHVVVGVNDIGSSVLDGFTITKGDAVGDGFLTVDNNTLSHYNGSAIYLAGNCAPVLSHLVVTGNHSVLWGGGLYAENNTAAKQYQLSNSTFSNNDGSFGGAISGYLVSPTITDVKLWNNTGAFGGGLYSQTGNVKLINVSIKGNTGASYAAAIYGPSSGITLIGCEITGNHLYYSTTNIMADRIAVVNSTIAGNSGGTAVLGIVYAAEIYNSVIYGNEAGVSDNVSFGGSLGTPGTILFYNSLVQGVAANATNHVLAGTTDPLFTNPLPLTSSPTTDGDYSLQAASPLIDAGIDSYYPGLTATTKDINGNGRVLNIIDIGASENHPRGSQTITAGDLSKMYGDADFDPGAVASSGLTVTCISSDNSIAEVVAGKIHIKKAGTITITASQSGNGTFTAAADVTFTVTINKAPLMVVANGDEKNYDGIAYSGGKGVTYSGFVYGEDESALTGTLTYGGDSQGAIDPGTYYLISLGLTAENYNVAFGYAYLTIHKGVITVTAGDADRCYDAADPAFAVSYRGFVNNETSAGLTTQAVVSTLATATSAAGDYALVPSGATSDHYTFSYVNGTYTIHALPVTTITTPDGLVLCGENSTVTLAATGAYTYAWSDGQSGNTISVATQGTYSLVATDADGCTAPAENTVTITTGTLPAPSFSYDSYCANAPVTFTNTSTGDERYVWTISDGQTSTATSPSFTFQQGGTYTVNLTATDNSCPAHPVTTSQDIVIENEIAGTNLNTVTVAAGAPIQLYARQYDNADYQWSPATGLSDAESRTPLVTVAASQRYLIHLSFASGCTTTDTLFVNVPNGQVFVVANAFTPNHDGLNDVLHVGLRGVASLEYFEVYNRWGSLVFRTSDVAAGWDGLLNDVGTYIWVAQGRDFTGQIVRQSGTVILIR